MSDFVVSARKYRPTKFDEVVGQKHVSQTLKNALKTDHLGHSFLFCGPRGVGKTTSARILAKAVNCTNKSADFEPCNTCDSCVAFNRNSSFNIYELDAASHNSVDDIRALTEQVRFAPQQGDYKIYIIDEVHMLSQSAFNAFLKTLEEPPSYAIFILATTEKHKILPTILSRCQVFDFHRVQVPDIVAHLQHICAQEGYSAEESALHVIAQKADGALRDALSIFDRIVSYTGSKISYQSVVESLNILDYDTFFQFTEALLAQDKNQVLTLFDDCLKKGFEGDNVILGLAGHFRDLLVSTDPKTLALLEVPSDVTQRYHQQAHTASLNFLLNAINIANDCDVHYKTAKNKRLHVELALLKMCFVGQKLHDQALQVAPSSEEKKTVDDTVEAKVASPKLEAESEEVEDIPRKAEVESEDMEAGNQELEVGNETSEESVSLEVETSEVEAVEAATPEAIEADIEKTPSPQQDSIQRLQAERKKFNANIKAAGGFTLGGLNSFKPSNSKENTAKEVDEEAIEINEVPAEAVESAWKQLQQHFESSKHMALANAISTSEVSYQDKKLHVTVHGNINKELLEQQLLSISELVKKQSGLNRLVVEFQVKEIDKTAQKTLTQKEQLEVLMEKNPAVKKLTDTFDLEIDYN